MKRQTITILLIALTGLLVFILIFNFLRDLGGTLSSGNFTKRITSKAERFVIRIDENAIYPNAMDLRMSGKIHGEGILCISWNDSVCYRTDTISNEFLVIYDHGDWYSDSCIVKFEPISVTNGELKIDYKIYAGRK